MTKILLADDDDNLRLLVRTTLEDSRREIYEAIDGPTALAMARRHSPDLLILDWMMPGMSGIDVANALRNDPTTANIPIIMLTARAQQKDRQTGHAAGVRCFLTKPFSPLQLLEKIDEICGEPEVGK